VFARGVRTSSLSSMTGDPDGQGRVALWRSSRRSSARVATWVGRVRQQTPTILAPAAIHRRARATKRRLRAARVLELGGEATVEDRKGLAGEKLVGGGSDIGARPWARRGYIAPVPGPVIVVMMRSPMRRMPSRGSGASTSCRGGAHRRKPRRAGRRSPRSDRELGAVESELDTRGAEQREGELLVGLLEVVGAEIDAEMRAALLAQTSSCVRISSPPRRGSDMGRGLATDAGAASAAGHRRLPDSGSPVPPAHRGPQCCRADLASSGVSHVPSMAIVL
jgi:hypothetical protein